MKKIIITLAALLGIGVTINGLVRMARAQSPANVAPFSYVVNGPSTSCPAIVANQTIYCYATDGPFWSKQGAAYVSMLAPPVVAGVTSWNGQTGAVTYTPPPPPVTSVNNKTGAVVLGASTQIQ